jgi:mono/diheme cytochrome c family protein
MFRNPLLLALGTLLQAAGALAAAPTFTRDVAPILYQHCAVCHHAGQVAPFPLLTYADAARRARLIADVTASRYMPPWKPVAGHFQNERRLTVAEIDTLRRWAASGTPEGDPKLAPPVPQFTSDWALGNPDLVIQLPKPFAVPAEGPDLYQCFVAPSGVPADRYIRAFEFRPSNPKVVHHSLIFTESSGVARQIAGPTGTYPCFGSIGTLWTSAVGGWSPGNVPMAMPEGTGVWLPRKADLVIQIHYHPTGKAEEDQSSVGLYFADKPPIRHLVDVGLSSRHIDIPAGETSYKVRDHFTLPVDVDAVGIIPHAHYVCRRVEGWAILRTGKRISLIRIDDWDFNWQDQYRYVRPLRLPADTRLEMELTYDNSESNPRNPNHPPKRVVWGPGVTDEMAGLHIQAIPVREEDMHELGLSLWGKVMREAGGSFYHLPPKNRP